jgi:hypothetical protein
MIRVGLCEIALVRSGGYNDGERRSFVAYPVTTSAGSQGKHQLAKPG